MFSHEVILKIRKENLHFFNANSLIFNVVKQVFSESYR